MKRTNRFLVALTTFIFVLSLSGSALAIGDYSSYTAQMAVLSNIDQYGSNLGTEKNTKCKTNNVPLNINQDGDVLSITGKINGTELNVNGKALATSENEHVLFFQTSNANEKYTVINLTYETNIKDSAIFFESQKETNSSVLKLYLKTPGTRNYVFLEVFNFQLNNAEAIKSSVANTQTPYSWVTSEFKAVDSTSDVGIMSGVYQNTYTITKTIAEMTWQEIHTITYRLTSDTTNVLRGQNATQNYSFEITGKTITCASNPNLNDSDDSYLRIKSVLLKQATVPNTAFVSSGIAGIARLSGSPTPTFSARIGYSLGVLGVTFSIPISFSDGGSVSTSNDFIGYINGPSSGYTRSCSVSMGSQYQLANIGDNFIVHNTIRDYGNVVKSSDYFRARWEFVVLNGSTLETYSYSSTENGSIAII